MVSAFTGSQRGISRPIMGGMAESRCTAMYGRATSGKFLTGSTSTTETGIKPTTRSRISSFCRRLITASITLKATPGLAAAKTKINSVALESSRRSGTQATVGANGTPSTQSVCGRTGSEFLRSALCVENNSSRHSLLALNTATPIAGLRRLEGAGASRPVYDLTVEKHHCYLANGLLVSNSDAFRYLGIAAELMTNDRFGGEHPILSDPRFSAGRMPATSYGY